MPDLLVLDWYGLVVGLTDDERDVVIDGYCTDDTGEVDPDRPNPVVRFRLTSDQAERVAVQLRSFADEARRRR